jgi:4-alpha-glucanotransferase
MAFDGEKQQSAAMSPASVAGFDATTPPPPPRHAGILLHPTSLPGRFGIGDLGPEAHRFLDWLAAAGQSVWQVLPLGPPGHGDSPYAARSTFAGSPLLLSPEVLAETGLLDAGEVDRAPRHALGAPVDYAAVHAQKQPLLEEAYRRFLAAGRAPELEALRAAEPSWLPDYALFMALREEDARAFYEWPAPLATRDPAALAAAETRLADRIGFHVFTQLMFDAQWREIRAHAARSGIRILGDLPIFPADDSADVWANQEYFHLDPQGRPTVIAGVPPDYFSATGQRWGNPVYRWDRLAADGYRFWIERFRRTFARVDLVRVDHFRGFEAAWHVPADAATAEQGTWVPGPGRKLFDAVTAALGPLPIIAEDLGLITPAVRQLRDELGFPGMKVLQFAFGDGPRDAFLPHEYERRAVAYTGTHDNDTTAAWLRSISTAEREKVRRYAGMGVEEVAKEVGEQRTVDALIRLAYQSVAELAIIPLQDVIGLGSEARMNVPAKAAGNWTWRFEWPELPEVRTAWIAELAATYGRVPERPAAAGTLGSADG